MRHLAILAAAVLAFLLAGCLSDAQWRTAGMIGNGVACGVAAANATPCTPQAVLDALARDAASQQAKVEAVAPQAAATDPVMAKLLMEQLAASAESSKAMTKALLDLAARSGPLPQYELPPVAPPPVKPSGDPLPAMPPPVLSPAPPKPTPLEMLQNPLGRVY